MKRVKAGGPPAGETWCWRTREMILSPAYREASINCRRLMDALEFDPQKQIGRPIKYTRLVPQSRLKIFLLGATSST